MQRWILLAVIFLVLLCSGATYAFWNHRQNLPDEVYYPLPFRQGLSVENQEKAAQDLKAHFANRESMLAVARDCDLMRELGYPSEDAAVTDLMGRLKISAGPVKLDNHQFDALQIGFRGKSKEHVLLQNMAERLMKDVSAYLEKTKAISSGASSHP
jgi:hypothetical protein